MTQLVDFDLWVTLKDAAREKGVTVGALRTYLRFHREIKTYKFGSAVFVWREDLAQYRPNKDRSMANGH